jgi:Flp pilus assembly protein TadG
MTMLYGVICMSALLAIASLGIDVGRTQAAKTELQRAVDAAARYGSKGLSDGTAVNKAITAAADNTIDADNKQALIITSSNVQTGHWDTTTKTFTSGGSPTDAIRVTATRTLPLLFSAPIGKTQCSVTATSICSGSGGSTPTFVGLNSITANNNTSIGYSSSAGAPGAGNQSSTFIMASNGTIDFGNNQSISGTVELGPSGSYTGASPNETFLATALSYPATENPPVATSGTLSVSGTLHVTGGGTLCYSSISFSNNATLIFDNPTTVYVTGNITSGSGPTIKPSSGVPADLKLRLTGGPSATAFSSSSNNVTIIGMVYAPAVDLQVKNDCTIYGSVLFRSITAKNNLIAYYDTVSGSVVSGVGSTASSGVQMVK